MCKVYFLHPPTPALISDLFFYFLDKKNGRCRSFTSLQQRLFPRSRLHHKQKKRSEWVGNINSGPVAPALDQPTKLKLEDERRAQLQQIRRGSELKAAKCCHAHAQACRHTHTHWHAHSHSLKPVKLFMECLSYLNISNLSQFSTKATPHFEWRCFPTASGGEKHIYIYFFFTPALPHLIPEVKKWAPLMFPDGYLKKKKNTSVRCLQPRCEILSETQRETGNGVQVWHAEFLTSAGPEIST